MHAAPGILKQISRATNATAKALIATLKDEVGCMLMYPAPTNLQLQKSADRRPPPRPTEELTGP